MPVKKPETPKDEAPQDVIATPTTPKPAAVVACPVCGNPSRVGDACAVDGNVVK